MVWTIIRVTKYNVVFQDGLSFSRSLFPEAEVGQEWILNVELTPLFPLGNLISAERVS